MKLRFSHNSIRIRVRKSDLKELEENGKAMERVNFPNGQEFVFGLEIKKIERIQALFQDAVLTVQIPTTQGEDWIKSEQVGLEIEQASPSKEILHILIEKDFPCKHKDPADNEDTFKELI